MIPNCKECNSEYVYEDGSNYVCPMCGYEWSKDEVEIKKVYKDAFGNILNDGDSVSIIKDKKVKGSNKILKIGTKARNIKLVEGDHDIIAKVDGWGILHLKTSVVKKI